MRTLKLQQITIIILFTFAQTLLQLKKDYAVEFNSGINVYMLCYNCKLTAFNSWSIISPIVLVSAFKNVLAVLTYRIMSQTLLKGLC